MSCQRIVVLGICLVLTGVLSSCETIPGDPYITPVYDPVTEEPIGVGAGWRIEFLEAEDLTGDFQLLLTTRAVSVTSRVYVLTCNGGPGDSLEWTASTASGVIGQLEEIAEDTAMDLPTDPNELDQLYGDIEAWIVSEWMTPNAYHTMTGR